MFRVFLIFIVCFNQLCSLGRFHRNCRRHFHEQSLGRGLVRTYFVFIVRHNITEGSLSFIEFKFPCVQNLVVMVPNILKTCELTKLIFQAD